MLEKETREELMQRALELAARAGRLGEVPIGCVVARGGAVIGEGANRREADADPTAHAEIVAIRAAARTVGSWRLEDAALVVTCEPCPMCAGAIVNARIPVLVFGCEDPKGGGVVSRYGIGLDGVLNHRCEVVGGVLAGEAASLLKEFFAALRRPR